MALCSSEKHNPSIHPFFDLLRQQPEHQSIILPLQYFPTFLAGHGGIHRPAVRYNLSSKSQVCLEAFSQWDPSEAPPLGCVQKADIRTRCPNHLNRLDLMWRSSELMPNPPEKLSFSLFFPEDEPSYEGGCLFVI